MTTIPNNPTSKDLLTRKEIKTEADLVVFLKYAYLSGYKEAYKLSVEGKVCPRCGETIRKRLAPDDKTLWKRISVHFHKWLLSISKQNPHQE